MPDCKPFVSRFLQAVRHYPESAAVCKGNFVVSYARLAVMVNTVARTILNEAPDEKRIAVADQNDAWTYASFIAINLLGKTYVPLHVRSPELHQHKIIREAQLTVLLSSEEYLLPGLRRLIYDQSETHDVAAAVEYTIPASRDEQPAYILFTSGSTGSPKGVPIYNRHLNAFFSYFLDSGLYDFSAADKVLQVYEASFDVSVFSAFLPLFIGGSVCLLPRKNYIYLEIPQALEEYSISVLSMVPTVLHYLLPYLPAFEFKSLRYSFFSGDKLFHTLASAWSKCVPQARIINCYGPTETTIVCTAYLWKENTAAIEALHDVVPLGKPFPGTDSLIIDLSGKETPLGSVGELCLTGAQVIDAYLNNVFPEQFFDRVHSGSTIRYYRTGDLVSMNKQGNLLFAGRVDSQVKINGYRVEPAEVEVAIRELTGSVMCAVFAHTDDSLRPVLYAFVEGKGAEEELRSSLKSRLQSQAIPARMVFLDKMPLNLHGKINRNELINLLKIL
jgi:D-alanine--poly(phosphoribitol) ligase subunit 1